MYYISICLFRVCASRKQFVGMELLRENELNKSDKIQKQKDVYAYPKFLLSMEAFLVEIGTAKSAMYLFFSRFNYGVFNEIKQ